MEGPEEIVVTPRIGTNNRPNNEEGNLTTESSTKKTRKHSGSRSSTSSLHQTHAPDDKQGITRENERQTVQAHTKSPEKVLPPIIDEDRVQFYEDYREMAKEYDKDFSKKYDEDLNTTLIFAGLFSAVTSAFIIQVGSQLQPDPSGDTAALLRVILYKIDNTAFGNDTPSLPQWTGAPRSAIQVQVILFASLSISLFAAFLAMLGKQWLIGYNSTDKRGSAIQRSRNRQQKLDGMVAWCFDYIMESLPLMLQASLLLLGSALSLYLWDVNIAVALVVLCMTSIGVLFYIFIVIAGTVFESCPYQTPAAHGFRYLIRRLHPALQGVISFIYALPVTFSLIFLESHCVRACIMLPSTIERPWHTMENVFTVSSFIVVFPSLPLVDAYRLGRKIMRTLVGASKRACGMLLFALLKSSSPGASTPTLRQKVITSDLRCISWILQTSLDKAIHLSALKHLTSMPELAYFHPTLVVDCFNIFARCINVDGNIVTVLRGSEKLAGVSADALFRILHHLATADPVSSILVTLQSYYDEVFPSEPNFTTLPFSSTMTMIHALAGRFGSPRDIQWDDYPLSVQEHIPFARRMVDTARENYRQTLENKISRRTLRSVLYFLSFGHLSPPSVVGDCLTIIAIDLGCHDVSNATAVEESSRVDHISDLITKRLDEMVEAGDQYLIRAKRKAINALFPYVIYLEQSGRQDMFDAVIRVAKASNYTKFMWRHIVVYISRLFEKRSPTSLNRTILLISPHLPWDGALKDGAAVARWAAAVSNCSHEEDVSQSVVEVLLRIASIYALQKHIPVEVWAWLKKRPTLPPGHRGRIHGGDVPVIACVRRLGDVEILTSYFLTIWSEWNPCLPLSFPEIGNSMREDFCGNGLEHHRRDLINGLERILGQLDRGLDYLKEYCTVGEGELKTMRLQYTKFRDQLREVDGGGSDGH